MVVCTDPGWGQGGMERYGRQEKRDQEKGFPRCRELGEIGKYFSALCNILQLKRRLEVGPSKEEVGLGVKGAGSGKFRPPVLPPPSYKLQFQCCI